MYCIVIEEVLIPSREDELRKPPVTGTRKHLKSTFKNVFLLVDLHSNSHRTFLGKGLLWSGNCSTRELP